MSATNAAKSLVHEKMYGEMALLNVGEAAVNLVNAKIRYKGNPSKRDWWSHWTKAELDLYDACKAAGLIS